MAYLSRGTDVVVCVLHCRDVLMVGEENMLVTDCNITSLAQPTNLRCAISTSWILQNVTLIGRGTDGEVNSVYATCRSSQEPSGRCCTVGLSLCLFYLYQDLLQLNCERKIETGTQRGRVLTSCVGFGKGSLV
jgi:hypothetical protein